MAWHHSWRANRSNRSIIFPASPSTSFARCLAYPSALHLLDRVALVLRLCCTCSSPKSLMHNRVTLVALVLPYVVVITSCFGFAFQVSIFTFQLSPHMSRFSPYCLDTPLGERSEGSKVKVS